MDCCSGCAGQGEGGEARFGEAAQVQGVTVLLRAGDGSESAVAVILQVVSDLPLQLREQQRNGIHYESVRAVGRYCYALLTPQVIASITPCAHYEYIWDGETIAHTLTIRGFN